MPRIPKSAAATARGRKQTDRSLGAERDKVDHSIENQRATAHRDADRAVGRSRDRSDEQTGKERARSDRDVAASRADKFASRASERRDADRRLRTERARSDQLIAAERQRADEATGLERVEVEAAQRDFFKTERMHTDRDLSRERGFADTDSLRSARALTRAMATHGRSRRQLSMRDTFLALLANDLRVPMQHIAVAAARLRSSKHLQHAAVDDWNQVETISRSAHEVLRLVGDLLERVELWQPSSLDAAAAPGRRPGVTRTRKKVKPLKQGKPNKQARKTKTALRGKKRTTRR